MSFRAILYLAFFIFGTYNIFHLIPSWNLIMRSLCLFLAVAFLSHNVAAAILHAYQIHDTAAPSLGSFSPEQVSTSTGLYDRSTDVLGADVLSLTSKNPEKVHFLHARQSNTTGALYCNSNLACTDGR